MRFPLKIRIGLASKNLLQIAAAAFIALGAVELRLRSEAPPSILNQNVASVDVRGMRLDEALTQLGVATGVKVFFDQTWLKVERLNESDRVDIRVKDVTLGAVLGSLNNSQLSTCIIRARGRSLYVVPIDRLPVVARAYDVTDIVDEWLEMTRVDKQFDEMMKAGSKTQFTRDQLVSEVAQAIQSIAFSEYSLSPGPSGAISTIGSRIIVVCPDHPLIEKFLNGLRKSGPGSPEM